MDPEGSVAFVVWDRLGREDKERGTKGKKKGKARRKAGIKPGAKYSMIPENLNAAGVGSSLTSEPRLYMLKGVYPASR